MVELLVTGLFGLLAGLGGVTLQSWLQRRDKDVDRQDRRRELLRSKAEEVFTEADLAVERVHEAYMQAIEDVHGQARTTPTLSLTPTGRLKALLGMYFPESDECVSTYAKRTFAAFQKQTELNEDAAKHPAEATLKLMREARMKTAEECMSATIELANNAKRLMQGLARTLV
jgi:hypothetical protein